MLERLSKPAFGLDFGCGKAQVLASLMEAQGHRMVNFDAFYYPDLSWQEYNYDFITCSEAIEHFHQPAREWLLWMERLKPAGWLGIMTKRVINVQRFAHWHYKNDPTHVSFFSENTFSWLANRYNMQLEFPQKDIVLLQKN